MQMTSDYKTNIELSAYLPHLNQPVGWLLLKGWFFQSGNTAKPVIRVSTRSAKEAADRVHTVEATLKRPDVKAVYPEAPSRCGFEIVIPEINSDLVRTGVKIEFLAGARKIDVRLHPVVDLSASNDKFGLVKGNAARLLKLNNLILNEQERLGRNTIKQSNPISLYIEPSFECNLNCPHCISNHLRSDNFHRPPLKMELLDDILETYGETLIKATLAMWGEPLLHKQFPDIVKKIGAHGIMTECSTNLALPLSNEQIEQIVSSGLHAMRLSVDGVRQETYRKYRVGGSIDQVLKNMRNLVEAKRRCGTSTPYLQWQFLEFPWNQHERNLAQKLAADIGVDGFNYFKGDLWEARQTKRDRIEADDFILLPDEMKKWMTPEATRNALPHRYVGCDFLDHCLAINSDGFVHPCCYTVEPKSSVGQWQVNAKNLDMFNTPRLQKLREFLNHNISCEYGPGPCSECGTFAANGHVKDQISFFEAFAHLTQA